MSTHQICDICESIIYDLHGLCVECHKATTPPPTPTPTHDVEEQPKTNWPVWYLDSGESEVVRYEQISRANVLVTIIHRKNGTFDVICDDDDIRREIRRERDQMKIMKSPLFML